MADLKTPANAPVNATTSVQAKKSNNIILQNDHFFLYKCNLVAFINPTIF